MSTARTTRKQAEPEPKQEKSGPVWNRRSWTGSGSVEVAIFEKEMQGDNGPYTVWNTVAKRSYKTDAGYESGNSFRQEDLLVLAMFLTEAASWICQESSRK